MKPVASSPPQTVSRAAPYAAIWGTASALSTSSPIGTPDRASNVTSLGPSTTYVGSAMLVSWEPSSVEM